MEKLGHIANMVDREMEIVKGFQLESRFKGGGSNEEDGGDEGGGGKQNGPGRQRRRDGGTNTDPLYKTAGPSRRVGIQAVIHSLKSFPRR